MSEARINLVGDATQLNQELERAAQKLREVRGMGDVTGQNLTQSLNLATKAQLTFNNSLKVLGIEQRKVKASMSGVRDQVKSLAQNSDVAGVNLRDLTGTYKRLDARLAGHGKALSNNEKLIRLQIKLYERKKAELSKLNLTQRQYRNSLDAITVAQKNLRANTKTLGSTQAQMGNGFRSLMKVGRTVAGLFGAGLGLHGLIMVARSATSVIMDFDQSIRTLASVSGASASELENLSSMAIKVGSASRYGATGVSELMTELSRMGFAVDEINNMTEGIVKLSTAAGEDLSKSAETVGNIIRAMGYDAENTGSIVNTMAVAFNKSALDLSRFRESMKYVSPLARSVGFSVENVSAVLAKLSDAGVSGSMAGTSLRNVFMSLSDSSSELSQALGGGITNFDDFIDAMERLKTEGISTGEIFSLIDRRAVTALNTILDNTGSIRSLSQEMEEANGVVDEMASIQMRSLTNQAKLFGNAWKGLILAVDRGDGALSNFIRGSLSGFSRAMSDLTRQMTLQSKQMQEQYDTLNSLNNILRDANTTYEERVEMIRELNGNYPEVFENMDIEKSSWEQISGAIDEAIEKKKAFLGIQFQQEDIETLQIKLERLNDEYLNFDQSIKRQYETLKLSEKQYEQVKSELDGISEAVVNASQGAGKFGDKMSDLDKTIDNTNITYREFLKILSLDESINQTNEKIDEGTFALKQMARETVSVKDAVDEGLFGTEIQSVIDEVINKFNELSSKAMEYEDSTEAAYNTAVAQAREYIAEQIKVAEAEQDQIDKRKTTLESQKVTSLENIQAVRRLGIEHFDLGVRIEALKGSYDELDEAFNQTKSSAQDAISGERSMLNLLEKIAILRAKIALDGIELERKLSSIRKDFADRRAKQLEDENERSLTYTLNELQREKDLQDARVANIKRRSELEQNAFDRRIDMLKREQELIDLETSGEGDSARIAALNREIDVVEQNYDKENEIREQAYKKEQSRIQEEKREKENAWTGSAAELKEIIDDLNDELIALDNEYLDNKRIAYFENNQKILDIEQKLYDAKVELYEKEFNEKQRLSEQQRTLAIQEAESADNIIQAMDILGIRTRKQRELEKSIAIDRLKERQKEIEGLKEIAEARLLYLETQLQGADGADANVIEGQIQQVRESLSNLNFDEFDVSNQLNQLLSPSLDMEAWENVISNLQELGGRVVDAYQSTLEEQYRIAQEERALRDRNISELQRDLDLQLRLNEQGFASNVQAYMQALEQEKLAREQALAEERQAAQEKRRIEQVVQTLNILSSISNILKQETGKFGLAGILTAGIGIAGLWSIWGGAKNRAQSATTYEKGGSFMLNGNSHANGGVMLAPGHEAQGGEMVSVFNRKATKNYGGQIKDVTEAFNKGKIGKDQSELNLDMKDVKAIRKMLEKKEQVSIQGNYKIIKSGNKTTICRLN